MIGQTKIHFFCNGIFSTSIAGGDLHCFKLAAAAVRAGYELNFFGGHALKEVLHTHNIPGTITLTDEEAMQKVNQGGLGGQIALFRDFYRRYRRSQQLLDRIAPNDFVYAASDYWFDAIPAVRCAARRKLMVFHMQAPSFRQIILRSRPDVDAKRLASIHYFLSQHLAHKLFRASPQKKLLYVHPGMKSHLLQAGYAEAELAFVSAGFDPATAKKVPAQAKLFDIAWLGRVHRQKGLDDLLATLGFLKEKLPDFRALLIGRLEELKPELARRGVLPQITFAENVTEVEKFRLLKSSRMFLMPSRYESWGSVVAEALASELPVVAYELEAYRPVFGDLVRYVKPFDSRAFREATFDTLLAARAGKIQTDPQALTAFEQTCSWETIGKQFVTTIASMAP